MCLHDVLMDEAARHPIFIDRGGTFTDCIGYDRAAGVLRVAKVLSSDRAPLTGVRRLLDLDDAAPIPPCDIRMGTTLGTNALLERRGARTALLITRGFGDLLLVDDQTRPSIFALRIERPEPLYEAVVEVDGRIGADGARVDPLDEVALRAELRTLRDRGIESLAIVFAHAYRDPTDELRARALALEAGFTEISLSHEVVAERGLLARAHTTVVDAYLTPPIARYVGALLRELPGSRLRIMQSHGGLGDGRRLRGRDAVLSGPAGGLVACASIARRLGLAQVIGFDMGGTSTDVSRWAGGYERAHETKVAGVRVRAPMLSIHTVAAGGGSICHFDGHRLQVGPQSAGADPGPLCYGRPDASALTLTDVALFLGRVQPRRFPFPLDTGRAGAALEAMAAAVSAGGAERTAAEVADGFFRVAVESMAAAIRTVTVARGHDVREHALLVFGGAAGQYCCAVARLLGVRTLVFHPLAGMLSAYGMAVAGHAWHGEQDAGCRALDDGALAALEDTFEALAAGGRVALEADGLRPDEIARGSAVRRLDLRYAGTESALEIACDGRDAASLWAAFEAAHERRYGYARRRHPIEIATARLSFEVPAEVAAVAEAAERPVGGARPSAGPGDDDRAALFTGERFEQVRARDAESIGEGERLLGPALVLAETGTLVVERGFALRRGEAGCLIVERQASVRVEATSGPTGADPGDADGAGPDPVDLEIFNNRFMAIAEQMGAVLERTALSTNIRDRLDFSCAIFDEDGALIANAPHIPVHLGAMSETVRAVRGAFPAPEPGDALLTNDPYAGGSHLPDLTVVSPVHDAEGVLRFYAASRGHHADIGGVTPGSMPAFSSTLEEEGVVLAPMTLVRGGRFDEAGVRAALGAGRYPARRPDENLADLAAQVAANRTGADLLHALCVERGLATVRAYMAHVQRNAAALVEEAIAGLSAGVHRFEDALDDGTPIAVALTVDRAARRMRVDFSGTAPATSTNLNAPRAVTVAAVLYVLRSLVGRDIPLNSGCLRPVALVIPEGSVLDPPRGHAVAGGNVETSQRIVDVLLGALGIVAASQGTMNNLTFGTSSFGYYETLGGGAGAGPAWDGASAVHTHMTNSRITDVEVLESRAPIRVRALGVRRGSGGAGRHRGGDGLVRELEALEPLRVSLLSERRERRPYGLRGGAPGAPGRCTVAGRAMAGKFSVELGVGQRIRVETPGGGGFGPPPTGPHPGRHGRDGAA